MEVRSGTARHMVAPEVTSAGRCDLKLPLTWQRVDTRSAPYLNLELVSGLLGLQVPTSTYILLLVEMTNLKRMSIFSQDKIFIAKISSVFLKKYMY
jgi:hypothetical protein